MSITPGIALPARVIRGSLSVTAPTVGRACNLLLAREPARRIERLYVHVGWLLSGFEVMEELGEEDFLTQIYWSQLGDHQEEHREAES